MWRQEYLIWGMGLPASAMLAALPVFALLLLLGVLRKPPYVAALFGLGVTLVLALFAYRMPAGAVVSAAAYGGAFGLFPISWIVFWAIVLYRITVETGKFGKARSIRNPSALAVKATGTRTTLVLPEIKDYELIVLE